MNVTLDIETIPCQKPGYFEKLAAAAAEQAEQEVAALKPPASLKKQETIDAWIVNDMPVKAQAIREAAIQRAEDTYRATSFDGAFGQIAVIGYAIDNAEPVTLYADRPHPNAEASLLVAFFTAIERAHQAYRDMRPVFIGHNVVDFDLRFIFQRAVVLGVKPPAIIPFHAKPWDDVVFDTMTRWAGIRGKVSLAKLCDALGLAPKGAELGEEIDGSMVWDMVKAGRIEDVAKYCAGDIERTRAIHKRLTFALEYPIPEETFGLEEAA